MGDQSAKCLDTTRMQLVFVCLIYLFFRSGTSMFSTIIGPHLLRIVCEKRFPDNRTVCDQLKLLPVIENEVREHASFYFILYQLFMNAPSMFSALFCGAWSDRKGRKIPMIFPCVGAILSAMFLLVSLYMGPFAIWTALLGTLIQSVLGNTAVFAMAVNAYIATVSINDQRTKNISILYAMSAFGQSFGAFLAGVLEWELLISYSIVIGFNCLTLLMTVLFVIETRHRNKDKNVKNTQETQTTSFTCSNLTGGIKSYKDLLTEKDTNTVRKLIIAQLCLLFIYGCDMHGVQDVFLMYVTARPFNWSKSGYSYYISLRKISTGITYFLVLPFLSNILKFSDSTMIIIGLLCNVSRYVGTGLSNKSWMLYALLSVWSVSLLTRPCIWSVFSKSVNEQELGKMYTLCSITETLASCVGSVIYVYLYGATVAFCPSIVFYVMGLSTIVILLAGIAMNKCFRQKDVANSISESCSVSAEASEISENNQSNRNTDEMNCKYISSNTNILSKAAEINPNEKSHLNNICSSSKLQYSATKSDYSDPP